MLLSIRRMVRPRGERATTDEISFGDRLTTIRVEVDVETTSDGDAADTEDLSHDPDDDAWLNEVASEALWEAEGVADDEPALMAAVYRAPRAGWLCAGVVAAAVIGLLALRQQPDAMLTAQPTRTAVVLGAALARGADEDHAEHAPPIATPGHVPNGQADLQSHPFPKTRFARAPQDDTLPRLRPDYGF